ncbi:MAG: CHAP domain-containing protein [Candidatus Paracaedibacteraceae bacterium]|nr:CHAP domain-containing protein [Candidatus Paracaedibacteraceae bacterium]
MIVTSDLRKIQLVLFAKEEGSLKLKGDSKKAGPEIEKFLSPFREILGKSDPRYVDINFGADWCAIFVYYLVVKAGYRLNIKPFKNKRGTFGLVGIWLEWGVLENKFRERSYEPEPGDLVLYDKLLSDSPLDHIGIVLKNNSNYLLTAEGNVNNMTGIFKRGENNKIRGYIRL